MARRGRPPKLDPVTAYASEVVSGEVVAGRLVRLACQRHLRDLELSKRKDGHPRGFWFDHEAVDKIIKFFGYLCHSKGEWAGQSLILAGWEEFIVGSIVGWKRRDNFRRYRLAYIEVARKNGKSTLSAGLGLYMLLGDKEAGAEIYCAATKRDQAKIVFSEAQRMRDKSPKLRAKVGKFVNNLHVLETASKMEPLGADADTMDGLNPHAVIIDELHAHKTRAVVEVMETALGARRQPLQFEITTAGYDRQSVCWERRQYVRKVLEGSIEDDSVFGYIATIDDGDIWSDESCWKKANPNLGVSVKLDYLKAKCAKALKVPGAQNSFRRLHLDIWTEAEETWLTAEAWEAVQDDDLRLEDYHGRKCWIGLDLSSKRDLTAMAMVFRHDDGSQAAFVRFWAPADGIVEREDRDGAPYRQWRDQEYLYVTPGPVVDYAFVAAALAELNERVEIVGVACDAYKRPELQAELDELGATEIKLVDHPQGFRKGGGTELWMPRSVLATEEAVIKETIRIARNPCLTWNAASIAMISDAEGNRKPDRRKSTGRTDGIQALIQGIGLMSVQPEAAPAYQIFVLGTRHTVA
jgi:phage terminase large subunit-like protein